MDLVRYFLAFVAVVGFPPVIVVWLIAHPLAATWRRLPLWVTYSLLAAAGLLTAIALNTVHRSLLAIEYGANPWLIGLGGLVGTRRRR